jgi:hypothetical protein
MIAEITIEKKYQSRAFLILPMSFNVAGILGPGMSTNHDKTTYLDSFLVMGGLLSEPSKTLPGIFGPDAIFGMEVLRTYPYALPGILNALFLTIVTLFVFFGLEEVHV